MIGEDPFEVERLWNKMYMASVYYGRRGAALQVISGIDIALWDIMGKALKLPIYKLGWYVHRTAKEAVALVRRLESFRPFFVEELLHPEDYDGYAQVAQAVDTLIASGEQESTEWGFRMLIEQGKVDVIQPDISRCGGFTTARKIVHMTELHNRLCVPHSWLSDLLTAATLHLNAFMRRSIFLEFNVTSGPLSREIFRNPIQMRDGYVAVPPGAGARGRGQ